MSFGALTKTIGGGIGAFGSQPKLRAPPFRGVTTPSLALSPQGVLSRSDQLVPQAEQRLFGNLAQNQAGILGSLPGIRGLQGEAGALRERTSGFFDRTAGLTDRLTNQLDELRPGFGRITESRVQGVRNAASQATGNLRSSLAKRNIEGSSFANRQISQIQETFAQEEDRVRAEAIVQEFQAQEQVINDIGNILKLDQQTLQQEAGTIALQLGLNEAEGQVFAQNMANIQTELAVTQGRITRELTELGISGDIITKVHSIASQVAVAKAQFDAQAAAARGKSFQQFGGGLDSLFDPLDQGSPGSFFGFGGQGAGGGQGIAGLGSLFGGGGGGSAGAAGGFTAGSGFASALPLSDRRVKMNIRKVGELDNGLTVYAYRLKSGGPTQIGVMAQEVETVNAGAVVEVDGIKRVNYDLAVV